MKSLLDKVNAKLNAQGGFLKAVSVLVGGTAIGQLISILALPILTRLYEPKAFSILAVYVSTMSLLTVIACMRFEIAIPLPKVDRTAAALCVLAIINVLFFSLLTTLFVIFFPNIFNTLTDNKISQFLWLIPIGVFAIGLYNALQYWSTRNKKFTLISKTRITQSVSGTGVKLGVGFLFGSWTIGLILGQLLAQAAGFLSLGGSLIKNDWKIFKTLRLIHLKAAFKRYDKFPKYSTLEALTNAGGHHLPIILIAYYAVGPEAGYLMVGMQLMSIPIGLLGSSIAQVYLAEGAKKFHQNELKKFTYNTIYNLAKIAFVPLLLAAIVSPFLVPYVLGEEWYRTGILISWMFPWFFMQLISSPVSMSLHITGNQKIALLLQVFGFMLRVGSVLFAVKFMSDYISEFYAISGFIFYSIYLIMVIYTLSNN